MLLASNCYHITPSGQSYLLPQSPGSTHTPSSCEGHSLRKLLAAASDCQLSTLPFCCSTNLCTLGLRAEEQEQCNVSTRQKSGSVSIYCCKMQAASGCCCLQALGLLDDKLVFGTQHVFTSCASR